MNMLTPDSTARRAKDLIRLLASRCAALLFAAFWPAVAAANPPLFTDLGTLGGKYSIAIAINASGQVAGSTENAAGNFHPFVWDPVNGMRDVGGGPWGNAYAINNLRQVVGETDLGEDVVVEDPALPCDSCDGFDSSPPSYHVVHIRKNRAFIWDPVQGLRDLGTLGGNESYASGINDLGQVVGGAQTASGEWRDFIWDATSGMQELGPLFVQTINSAGQLVGTATIAGGGFHAAIRDVNGLQDLGVLEGDDVSAGVAINAAGAVVGWSAPSSQSGIRGFIWDSVYGMRDVGTLGGTHTFAQGINAFSEVVGWSNTARDATGDPQSSHSRAFLWRAIDGIQDLGVGISSYAYGINDAGQIVGSYQSAVGLDFRAFLLNPPAPTIDSWTPDTQTAGSDAFTLTVHGENFRSGATVLWNGSGRPATFVSSSQLTAEISKNDVAGGADIVTVIVTVRNPNGAVSNPGSFTVTPANVSAVQSTAADLGEAVTVSTAPVVAGQAGVTATVENTGDDAVSVTVANYSSNPSGTAFSAGGGFTDVQITGATPSMIAAANFYYPSTIDAATEVALMLVYFNGSAWVLVRSDGNTDPVKDTTDNLDGTISGGRFTVVFSDTSTPKITELNGTVFAVADITPTINVVSTPASPTQVQSSVPVAISYSAAGNSSAHTVTLTWGDGSTTVITPTVSGVVDTAHVYTTPGVYTITVTLEDGVHPAVRALSPYVVIYDPNGGFVTGGGWINSQAGAYVPDPSLAGKANFGFVSKYQKGATMPTGQTQFQFQVANLNFHSTAYEWLVVSGAKAQYKGTGTINGAGNYGFLLTATDGQVSGGGGVDNFRIKIWDINNGGAIVYDNVPGASEDINNADPQAIGGGSIVIHK